MPRKAVRIVHVTKYRSYSQCQVLLVLDPTYFTYPSQEREAPSPTEKTPQPVYYYKPVSPTFGQDPVSTAPQDQGTLGYGTPSYSRPAEPDSDQGDEELNADEPGAPEQPLESASYRGPQPTHQFSLVEEDDNVDASPRGQDPYHWTLLQQPPEETEQEVRRAQDYPVRPL